MSTFLPPIPWGLRMQKPAASILDAAGMTGSCFCSFRICPYFAAIDFTEDQAEFAAELLWIALIL